MKTKQLISLYIEELDNIFNFDETENGLPFNFYETPQVKITMLVNIFHMLRQYNILRTDKNVGFTVFNRKICNLLKTHMQNVRKLRKLSYPVNLFCTKNIFLNELYRVGLKQLFDYSNFNNNSNVYLSIKSL